MSYLIFLIFALCLPYIHKLPLVRGLLGLKLTFWGFGVVGAIIMCGVSGWYFGANIDSIQRQYQLNGLFNTILAGCVVYSYVVTCAIWNASKASNFIFRWGARYFSLFYVSFILGCAIFLKVHYVLLIVLWFFMRKRSNKQSSKAPLQS